MKELSIEDKAKAYDEAVEKLRSLHDDYDTVSTLINIKEELENIFPELKESEDERIRKELIKETKGCEVRLFETVTNDEFIAWLEKQVEKDEEILILKDQIESLHAAIKAIKETHKIELEKQGEQKPVWSEEDERIYQSIMDDTVQENQLDDKQTNWLNSLKDRYTWKPSDEQMRQLSKYCPDNMEITSLYEQLKKLKG